MFWTIMFIGCDSVGENPSTTRSSSGMLRKMDSASRAVKGDVQYSRSSSFSHCMSAGHVTLMPSGTRAIAGRVMSQCGHVFRIRKELWIDVRRDRPLVSSRDAISSSVIQMREQQKQVTRSIFNAVSMNPIWYMGNERDMYPG